MKFIEPDAGHESASPLLKLAWVAAVQLATALAVSNPPSLITFWGAGSRHAHALLVQLKEPAGQSATTEHCLHVLFTHAGADDEHVPHV